MKCIKFILVIALGLSNSLFAQDSTFVARDLKVTSLIEGTLFSPISSEEKVPLVIIIQGSGPTDRDGNQNMLKNNSLLFLAEALSENNIASFRFDKRIVSLLRRNMLKEEDLSFEDFIDDAIAITNYFKEADAFSKIYIAGHSQGSLIGMIAANGRVDGFISLAGAGQSIDNVIIDQLALQMPGLVENAQTAFNEMRTNGSTSNYSMGLASIFRPAIQPFMLSWMKYDPKVELSKLEIPVLIINGTKDFQVSVSEAELLKEAKPDATYVIIENMNHILKEIFGNDLENSKSYNDYKMPLHPDLIGHIVTFIKQ